jgi:hypothetical protein
MLRNIDPDQGRHNRQDRKTNGGTTRSAVCHSNNVKTLLSLKLRRSKYEADDLKDLGVSAGRQQPCGPVAATTALAFATHIWNFPVIFVGRGPRFYVGKRLFDLFMQ